MSVLATTGPESGGSMMQLVPIPTLNILPPSSDTEAWSRFPSPRPPRRHRLSHPHRSRGRTKKRSDGEQEESSKPQWDGTEGVEKVKGSATPQRSPSPLPSPLLPPHVEDAVLGPSLDLLLPPSSRTSWSRSSSLGRRSRWSLRSLLSRESDWDSCRSVLLSLLSRTTRQPEASGSLQTPFRTPLKALPSRDGLSYLLAAGLWFMA